MKIIPKKSLGQNFLTDINIINKIIDIGEINEKDDILEIGPGTGNLTREIIKKKPKKIFLIEKDKLLYRNLIKEFKNDPKNLEALCNLADKYFAENMLKTRDDSFDGKKVVISGSGNVAQYAAEKATQIALEAIQCLGGNGYINDYPTGRLLRDAKLYEIGAGTSEIRRMLIGRELFQETA